MYDLFQENKTGFPWELFFLTILLLYFMKVLYNYISQITKTVFKNVTELLGMLIMARYGGRDEIGE